MHTAIQQANWVSAVSKYVELKKQGAEYVGLCPFHKESTPSFSVNQSKQIIKCFGCGWSGDLGKFIMDIEHVDFKQALNKIDGTPEYEQKTVVKTTAVLPVPDSAPAPDFYRSDYGHPSDIYTYRSRDNRVLGYVARYNPPNNRKQIIPFTYRSDGHWKQSGFGKTWPLYGLNNIKPGATVVIGEGEKTCDAIQANIPNCSAVTWGGGAETVKRTDWSPIYGSELVILVPDNDHTHCDRTTGEILPFEKQPGIRAMLEIQDILKPHVKKILFVHPPGKSEKCGWDVADRAWKPGEMQAYFQKNIKKPEPKPTRPYTALGFKKTDTTPRYCFFAGSSRTVVQLSATSMTESNLMELAPINYWEANFPVRTGTKRFDVMAAAQYLINECQQIGIFAESRIRGRGGWIDNDRTVIHSGDKLIIDGSEFNLNGIESKYIYEQGLPMEIQTKNPLPNSESAKIIDLLNMVTWQRPVNAYLLAGWCVIAPVCGALPWRPHIWISGSAGTGKSWVFQHIVRPLLGETGIAVQGKTTEPGIRNLLKYDALPVVFDEAEGEDQNSQQRIQDILKLMRGASVSDGGVIAQGASGGGSATYKIRSCFAFASIGVQMNQQADKSRITLLEIKKINNIDERESAFKKITNLHAEIINDKFVRGLHARTIKLLPTIVKNSETLNRAAAAVLGDKRHGDQLGPMLAGAYSLLYDGELTYANALEWVKSCDWSEEQTVDMNRDEYRLFNYIMEQIIEAELDTSYRSKLTVGELVQVASKRISAVSYGLSPQSAETILKRHGIKIYNDIYVAVSNSHDGIKRILNKTPWGNGNHGSILTRIEGAEKLSSTRFGEGVAKSNAVALPLLLLD